MLTLILATAATRLVSDTASAYLTHWVSSDHLELAKS